MEFTGTTSDDEIANSDVKIESSAAIVSSAIFDLQKALWLVLVKKHKGTAGAAQVAASGVPQSQISQDLHEIASEIAQVSLKICDTFTKEWNEKIFRKTDYFDLSAAIIALAEWLSCAKGDERIVRSSQLAASYCKLMSDYVTLEIAFSDLSIAASASDDKVKVEAVESSKKLVDEAPIATSSSSTPAFSETKPLSVWKDTHKDLIKKQRVLIASGRYEGKEGTFVRWNGSTAYIRIGALGDIGLSIQTKVKLVL